MHDLTRAKLILDAELHTVLGRAQDRQAAGAALQARIDAEVAAITQALAQAPDEKASLQRTLAEQNAQLAKLAGIIEGAKQKGRDDLAEAARERREALSLNQGVTRMGLDGFDMLVAQSRAAIRDLEKRAYALRLELQKDAPPAPTPAPSPSEPADAADDLGDLEALLGDTTATPAPAPGGASPAPAPAPPAAAPARAPAAAQPAPEPADGEPAQPASADAPAGDDKAGDDKAGDDKAGDDKAGDDKAGEADLDAEFAALMAAMGEDSAPAPAASAGGDGDEDLDAIMAGLTLDEVGADELPPGADAELAKEDAEIAAKAKEAGIAPPVVASVPAVVKPAAKQLPASRDKPGVPADKAKSTAVAKADKDKAQPPAKAGKKRRVWPWIVGPVILGGGGYAAYVYLWPMVVG